MSTLLSRRAVATWLLLALVAAGSGSRFAWAETPDEDTAEAVQYLLAFVAGSDCTFVRNGRSYTPADAVAHIESKYKYFKKEIRTPEDFIRLAASKSELSGRPYLVRTKDGKEMEAAEWLKQALDEHRASRTSSGINR